MQRQRDYSWIEAVSVRAAIVGLLLLIAAAIPITFSGPSIPIVHSRESVRLLSTPPVAWQYRDARGNEQYALIPRLSEPRWFSEPDEPAILDHLIAWLRTVDHWLLYIFLGAGFVLLSFGLVVGPKLQHYAERRAWLTEQGSDQDVAD